MEPNSRRFRHLYDDYSTTEFDHFQKIIPKSVNQTTEIDPQKLE
jgi:hypothetical protein